MTISVAITGASGRLGSVARAVVERSDDFELAATLGSRDDLEAMTGADVLFDATVPAASPGIVEYALDHGLNVLVGTSGWTQDRLRTLASHVDEAEGPGVIVVPNFSLGSALATSFAVAAARFYDSIEIVETHGLHKIDSPSGTAVRTAELMAQARHDAGPVDAPHSDQRARGQQVEAIPVHSLRMAGVAARQEVLLTSGGERLVLAHDTFSPAAYEAGIDAGLRAAASATGLTVGLENVLDLGVGGSGTR